MKYLSNRDEFLKRSIDKIDEFKQYEEFNKLFEAESGPFANDIPWGDSLVGRLINRVVRNAKSGANLVRIKAVIRKLRDAMDDILDGAVRESYTDENKKDETRLLIFSLVENLEKAIQNGEDIDIIIGLTEGTIEEVKKVEIENKEELIKQLEEFLDFLNQLKKGKSDEGEKEEEKEEEGKPNEEFYSNTITLLKSVITLNDIIKEKKVNLETTTSNAIKLEVGKEYLNQNNKVCRVISLTNMVSAPAKEKDGDGVFFTKDDKIGDKLEPNQVFVEYRDIATKSYESGKRPTQVVLKNQLKPYTGTDTVKKPVAVNASFYYENESLPIFEAEETTNNNPQALQHAKNAWLKVNKVFQTSGIEPMLPRIKELISKAEAGEKVEKNWIMTIGKQVILNEQTIGKNQISYDTLIKEAEAVPTSYNDIPKAISLVSNVILAFKGDLGLASQIESASQPIKDFVNCYNKLKELLPKLVTKKKEEENKEEVKKESKLLRYSNFVSINEAEEGEQNTEENKPEEQKPEVQEVSKPEVETTAKKIQDYWSKNIDVKAFTMEKTEVVKAKNNLDAVEKDVKSGEKKERFLIYGIDPVIEIVKCFNRAYKLHTTKVIPNVGTSDGRVSASTFAQYTCFGDGNKRNAGLGGGPYRNNAIFNQWEDAVLDILKEKKYQPIFNMETKIKVGDAMIEKAGANLRKFMSDMLDGDDFYKTGKDAKGLQAKFLDQYFGYKETDPKDLAIGGAAEVEENSNNASGVKNIKLEFTSDPIPFETNEDLKGSFFAAQTQKSIYYFFVQAVVGDTAYLVYSQSFYAFEKYISQSGTAPKITKGNLPRLNRNPKIESGDKAGNEYMLKATRKKVDEIINKEGKFNLNGRYEVTYISKFEAKKNNPNTKSILSDKPEEIIITNCSTLYQVEKDVETKSGKKRYSLSKDITTPINNNGGFINITGVDNINKTQMLK